MDQGVKVWKLPSDEDMRRVIRELAEVRLPAPGSDAALFVNGV